MIDHEETYSINFILTPFLSPNTLESAQPQYKKTKSMIILIESGLEIKYLKAIFQDMSNNIEFIVYFVAGHQLYQTIV